MSGIIIRQYEEFLLGKKTQTRRLKLPKALTIDSVRAVVPKYGRSAHWFGYQDNEPIEVHNPVTYVGVMTGRINTTPVEAAKWLSDEGFVQARLIVNSIKHQGLHAMSQSDALAEGIVGDNPVQAYAELWDALNIKKGSRWSDDPTVWVICFSRPIELELMVSNFLDAGHVFKSPFPLLGE